MVRGGLHLALARKWLHSPVIFGCLAFVTVVLACAVFGAVLAPYDPNAQHLFNTLAMPDSTHLFGTDELGRDVLSRAIAGTRSAVIGPLLISAGVMVVSSVLGVVAGYRGGWIDATIMRTADLVYAMPGLLVAIVAVGVLGGGYLVTVGTFFVLFLPQATRIARGAALTQRSLPYVEAVRVLGVPEWRIMFTHLWPNIAPIVLAQMFLMFAGALVALSSLSFLGLGVPPGTPDWGRMLADGRDYLFASPWAVLVAGGMIVLTATTMNLLGDWLQERIAAS
jgi:peptide/nickel transport system permease protein